MVKHRRLPYLVGEKRFLGETGNDPTDLMSGDSNVLQERGIMT
jgi:hypothetical protein